MVQRQKEGLSRAIIVRDMFAGGLSEAVKRVSYLTNQLRSFIAGKMTAVMQITDTAVAFELKKKMEEVKQEMRARKAGESTWESACAPPKATAARELSCNQRDMLYLLAESLRRLKHEDEVENPERLLKAMRSAGFLHYRGDPKLKKLIPCAEEWWLRDRLHELPEASHRHPAAWWDLRIGATQTRSSYPKRASAFSCFL